MLPRRLLSFPHLFTLYIFRVFWRKFSDIKVIIKNTVIVKSLHGVFHFTIMHIGDASTREQLPHSACSVLQGHSRRASHGSFKRRDGKVIVENNNIYCHSSAITSLGVKWLTTNKQSSDSNKNDEKSPEIFARATIICSVPSDVNCYYKLLWRMRFTGENIHILMTFRNILIHTVVIWHYINVPGQSRNYNFWQFTLRHHVFLSKLLL